MKTTIIILLLSSLGFYSCSQSTSSIKVEVTEDVKKIDTIRIDESRISTQEFSDNTYFHTEANYTDSAGLGIIIQNGFPRGGGTLYTANEIPYGHAVLWSRVVNNTETPVQITVNFPADSIVIFPSSGVHFKLFVPQDTMTLDKVSKFGYGLENIRTIVESNFHQGTKIERTIQPNEDCIFYVILLSHLSTSDTGVSRTGLFLKGQDLFYRLTVDASTSKLVPCGRIAFENDDGR